MKIFRTSLLLLLFNVACAISSHDSDAEHQVASIPRSAANEERQPHVVEAAPQPAGQQDALPAHTSTPAGDHVSEALNVPLVEAQGLRQRPAAVHASSDIEQHVSESSYQPPTQAQTVRQRPAASHTVQEHVAHSNVEQHTPPALGLALAKLTKARDEALASANTHADLATKHAAEAISAPIVMSGAYLSGLPGAPGRAKQYAMDGRLISAVDQITGVCWRLAAIVPASAFATAMHGYKAVDQFCRCLSERSRVAALDERCELFREALEGARNGDLRLLAAIYKRYGDIVRAVEHYEVRNPLRMTRVMAERDRLRHDATDVHVEMPQAPFPVLHARRRHRSPYFSVAVDERRPVLHHSHDIHTDAETRLHHQNAQAASTSGEPSSASDAPSTPRPESPHEEAHAPAGEEHTNEHDNGSQQSDSDVSSLTSSSEESSTTDSDDATPSRVAHIPHGGDQVLVDVVRLPEQRRKIRKARRAARKTWRQLHDTTKVSASLLRGATDVHDIHRGWHPDHDPIIQQWTEMPHLLVSKINQAASSSRRRGRTPATYSSGEDSDHND